MMTGVIIRPVTMADSEAFFALRLEALKSNPEAFGASYEDTVERWTAETYSAARIPEPDSDDLIICAEYEGELVGMMGFYRESYPKGHHNGTVWGVFARPTMRGQGIGKKMLEAILDHAQHCDGLRRVTIAVITENQIALRLYQSLGFTIWGTQPDALRDGDQFYDEHWLSYRIE